MKAQGLVVYAVTRNHELTSGIPVRLITSGAIAAVVADADLEVLAKLDVEPIEEGPLAALVREHDAVVRAVAEHEPVLPLRFGSVVREDDDVVRLLDSGRDEMARRLDEVEHHSEWGVRVEHVAPVSAAPTEGLSGTEYLLRRKRELGDAERERRVRQDAVGDLHASLGRHAKAVTTGQRRPQALLDAAYLVSHRNRAAFEAELARLRTPLERLGATVHATGPWPPYSFARIELAVSS